MIRDARAERAQRILWHEMKGSTGVTDYEGIAFLSQQPGIEEVNFCRGKLLKECQVYVRKFVAATGK